ncbi:hypothetical protein AGMMS49921_08630 [Endomicrobiia bacterium]|nr:hypothetical protein AGMMS49921_08630 [Endomicrobiia bacterium]
MIKLIEREKLLLYKIKIIIRDNHSDMFIAKSIKELGVDRVEAALTDTMLMEKDGKIKTNIAKCLTDMLSRMIKDKKVLTFERSNKPTKTISDKKTNILNLIQNIANTKNININNSTPFTESTLALPRTINKIYKVLFLTSNKFFTHRSNPKKSEKMILETLSTKDGIKKNLMLIKGKAFEGGTERGMLSAFHARIMYALTHTWEEHGKQYMDFFNQDIKICYCNVKIKKLASTLGLKYSGKLGGRQYTRIKRAVDDLNTIPFYFDCSEFDEKIEHMTFKFLQTTIFPKYKNKKTSSIIRVEFSQLYSKMLIQEQGVRRDKSICKISDPLAFFLMNYMESILIRHGCINIGLTKLIKRLDLQKASWHNFKSTRMRQFKKATDKLLKSPEITLSDGSTIASIEYNENKDKNDFNMKITTTKAHKVIDITSQVAI